MRRIRTIGQAIVAVGAIIMLATPVMAGNGKGSGLGQGGGDQTRTRTQSRLKDGANMAIEKQNNDQRLTHNGKGTGDCTGPEPLCTCSGTNCFCEGEA